MVVFDDFGQMLRQTSPVTGETTYEYDDAGNLTRTVDARGAVTTRSYDAMGRVLQSVTTGEGSSETVTWGYDAGAFGVGRMTSMTDGLGTVSYTYDRRGLLLTETRPLEGTSYVTKYAYDANGNRTKVTYPSARVVDTTYDWAGRPVTATGKVGSKSTSYVTAASYLPFGPMTSMTHGNGLVKAMTYDARYRLDRVTIGSVADYDYGYDPAGNVKTIEDKTAENSAYNRGYGYDDLNRLTSATGPWGGATYTYDAMGSMTGYTVGARSATFAYAGTTPKLVTAYENGATVPVAYDAAGNELTGTRANGPGVPSEQRWYTPRNSLHLVYLSASGTKSRPCLVGQSCPNVPAADTYYEFGYDGRGVRAIERKRSGSTLTTKHYAYTPELTFLGHKAPGRSGTGIEVVWFAGAPVAQEVWATHGQTKWTFTDHLGTPLLQTNSSKAVVWRAEYEPYGNDYSMRNGTKDDQPLRFPGQERLFDGSTGTEERYNIFRWYRSGWAKYTQADPLELRAGVNLFQYANASPTRFSDRFGLVAWDCDLTIGSASYTFIGGAILKGHCRSRCVNGRWVSVDVWASFIGLSKGGNGFSVGPTVLEDGLSTPSRHVFKGGAHLRQVGASVGNGWGHTELRLGLARTPSQFGSGLGDGFSFDDDSWSYGTGIDLLVGESWFTKWNEGCCKN